MACNSISLSYNPPNNFYAACGPRTFQNFYITGLTFDIGQTIFTTNGCASGVVGPDGWYSLNTNPVTYGYVQNGIVSYTGQCGDCVTGVVPVYNSYYSYYDCCGNLIQGYSNQDYFSIPQMNSNLPYSNSIQVAIPTMPISPSCGTPTPTPTTTITPTITPTPSFTPTNTKTPTPTPSFTPEPTSEPPIHYPYNSCDAYVSFPMGISCGGTNPTVYGSSNGTVRVNVTGGTTPYKYYWSTGQRTQTINNQPAGSYTVTVVDYYGDYTATTTCILTNPVPNCNLSGSVNQIGLPTPTPTNTPTVTTTPTHTPTQTPTPTNVLFPFIITGSSLTGLKITTISSTTNSFQVNWGDGNIDTFGPGLSSPSHQYLSTFNGQIKIESLDLNSITKLSIEGADVTGSTSYPIIISTSELNKLNNLEILSFGIRAITNGLLSQLPTGLTYTVIQRSNLTGSTFDLPINLDNLQLYDNSHNNVISGDTGGLPNNMTYCAIFAQNTISGDTVDLPRSLINLAIQGDNTITGRTDDLPPLLEALTIQGFNTISNFISLVPSGLTYLNITGNNIISGDLLGSPTNLETIYIGGDNTISGDTSSFPSSLTYILVEGNNTIGGDVANLPTNLNYLYLLGSGTTAGSFITGNIVNLPSTLTTCGIFGYNEVTGSFSDFPTNLTNIVIEGNNTITGYTSPHIWPTTMSSLQVYGNATVSTPNINNILQDLADYSTSWSSPKKIVLKGTSTNPTAEATLISRNVTINITP